ncbi:MAG: prepilin-type N-terminal cleavage/methylation domain-containing protein [Patescibacteria group bacterium]
MNNFLSKLTCRHGFTLMEIVVVMFIFTLASILIAEIFVNVQKAQQKIRDTQVAYTDARYLMEVMAREIRSDLIDYVAYGTISDPNDPDVIDKLYLATSQGAKVVFRYHNPCPKGNTAIGCVTIKRDTGEENVISSPKLSIDTLTFYITPLKDPFPENVILTTPDIQPQVTIVLKASSTNIKIEDQKPIYLQTTVASRAYVR